MTQVLDTAHSVETPEGIGLDLHVAGPVARLLAFGVDLLIRTVAYIALGQILPAAGEFGFGIYLIGVFAMEWFYAVPFEVLWHGQTPGKRALKLRVLRENGVPVGWAQSLTRNLLRAADFLPFFYGFGLLSMLIDRRFRRLGDLAAGTIVVYGAPSAVSAALIEGDAAPPPRPLELDEQVAITGYAERLASFTPERAAELAEILAPILGGARDQAAVARVRAYAAWIGGGR